MTLALQRQRFIVLLLVLSCLAAFTHISAHAMVVVGDDSPIRDMGWPKGVVEVANLPSRYRWVEGPPFGGGEYRFEYQGYAQDFNEALERFAEIRAPKLELVVHDGPGRNYAANDDEQQGVDWAFTIWVSRSFYRLYKKPEAHAMADAPGYGEPLPPPRIDIYVWKGGSINWKDVVIPAGIEVIDERAASAGITPVGGGVLVGSVYDMGTGKPVEGAVVSLVQYGRGVKPETAPTGTVDADGAFRIDCIPKGSYRVHLEADGYAPREAPYYINRELAYEKRVVYLAQSAAVRGTVVDPEGNPVPGAQVHAWTPVALDGKGYRLINGPHSAVTDEAGLFKFAGLPEGYIHLRCSGDWNSNTMFELYPAPSDAIRLTAVRTGTIRGTLIDSSGEPVSGTVQLVPEGDPAGRWHGSATADENGAFEILNVPPDDYLLGTSQALVLGEEDRTAQSVSLTAGEQVIVNVVASEEPGFEREAEDESVPIARKVAPEAIVLQENQNLGFAGGVNAGIRSSRGEWIAVLNNDTEATPEWLTECVRAMQNHPDASFFACRILNYADRNRLYSAGDCFLRAGIGYRRGQEQQDHRDFRQECEIFSASGCAALYRREVLDSMGGFDDRFFAYLEDVDLGLRLQAKGCRGYYVPAAEVFHHGAGTSGGEFSPLAVRLRTRQLAGWPLV